MARWVGGEGAAGTYHNQQQYHYQTRKPAGTNKQRNQEHTAGILKSPCRAVKQSQTTFTNRVASRASKKTTTTPTNNDTNNNSTKIHKQQLLTLLPGTKNRAPAAGRDAKAEMTNTKPTRSTRRTVAWRVGEQGAAGEAAEEGADAHDGAEERLLCFRQQQRAVHGGGRTPHWGEEQRIRHHRFVKW